MNFDTNELGIPDLYPESHWNDFANRHGLTDREICAFRLVCRALSNDEIATELGIQLPTLRTHLRSVYNKLGCHDRTHAVLLAVQELNRKKTGTN